MLSPVKPLKQSNERSECVGDAHVRSWERSEHNGSGIRGRDSTRQNATSAAATTSRRIVRKQRKADDHHAHQRRGQWAPLACHAPPTHPASCPCPTASRTAAFRSPHPPQVEHAAPDGRAMSEHTKGEARVRHRRRRPLAALSAAPPRSRRRSSASWSTLKSMPKTDAMMKLRLLPLPNECDAGG